MATQTATIAGSENIQNLVELLGFEKKSHYSAVRTRVGLRDIIVLPQPRRTFNEIEELGLSILIHNIIYLPVLAYFNRESLERYLSVLSILWRTPLPVEDYLPFGIYDQERGENYYKVLIDGERRIRGCRRYLTVGCEDHPDVAGCYKLHFGDECVEVTLCVNISPMEALLLQSVTNSHNRVPANEDAIFLDNLFRMFRLCDPKFPVRKFARLVGRSPETVKNAVRFCGLPEDIQTMVPDEIPYGIACMVAWLQESADISKAELHDWALMAITGKYKVPDFRKVVGDFVRQQQNGQTSLLDLFSDKQREELKKGNRRMIVARHTIHAIWDWINYFTLILRLFEEGKLGKEDSPFSVRSPVRVFRTLIEKQKQMLPHLSGLLQAERYETAKETLQTADSLLRQLEEVVPE